MRKVIELIAILVNYDTLYIGGGNARLVKPPLPNNVLIVSNEAGITGGIRLWDRKMDDDFVDTAPPQLAGNA